jgi:hypothetical protein
LCRAFAVLAVTVRAADEKESMAAIGVAGGVYPWLLLRGAGRVQADGE